MQNVGSAEFSSDVVVRDRPEAVPNGDGILFRGGGESNGVARRDFR